MFEATQPTARLRASLANAAFAVEDRVAIAGGGFVRGMRQLIDRARDWSGGARAAAQPAVDAVRWPFERLAWAVQRHLLWPLQDRADGWSRTTRAVGGGAVALAALGACALGLVLTSGGGHSAAELAATPAPPPPAPSPAPVKKPPAAPVLHGVTPTFKPEKGVSGARGVDQDTAAAGKAKGSNQAASTQNAPDPAVASIVGTGDPAGPAALKVAHRFADAFVLYEIGQGPTKARATFSATATPELARSLLHRPPRLPANVRVPKAKVINVVAAPSHGGVFPISVSLLRVGVTSELRLNMQRGGKPAAGKARPSQNTWRVTEVTG